MNNQNNILNKKFKLSVYSRKYGHSYGYEVIINETGWHISYQGVGEPSDKYGKPALFDNLRRDEINYPARLPEYMKRLWNTAFENNLSCDEIQEALEQLGQWISICEKNTPVHPIWERL